jgi:type IV pilus assembly protein PilC
MGLFRYEAVDSTGKVLRGVMNACDERQVARKLQAMGYSVRGIYAGVATARPAPKPRAAPVAVTQQASGIQKVTLASGVPVSIKSKVPVSRLAMFFRQLVTLVKSGIPLYQSFGDLAVGTHDRRLRNAIPRMQGILQSGQPLSTAMAAFPDLFPAHTIASVWCGELSGKLDVILGEVADDLEQEAADTRLGRIGWGIVKGYTILFILTAPLFTLLGRMTEQVLGDSPAVADNAGSVLGSVLRSILSDIYCKSVPLALAVIVAWVAWGHAKRIPSVRRMLDGALLCVPIWGKIHRSRSVARFLHLLDELYSAGINPSQAWDAASVAPRNSAIVERLRGARRAASAATGITELAAISNVLESDEIGLLAAGEKAGKVPESLGHIAAMYLDKAGAQRTAGRVLSISLMNSLIIFLSGLAVIVFVKSYFAPMARFLGV